MENFKALKKLESLHLEPETKNASAIHKSLQYSLWDCFFFSLMVGIGETYLPAYALSAGMPEWLAGLFATVPLMAGAALQLLSPWAIVLIGSMKRWVVGASLIQAVSFLPLLYFTLYPPDNFFGLFVVASIYWAAGFTAGPSWNNWMNHLISEDKAASFFALRHRISQIGIVIGLVGGGLALHYRTTMIPFTSVFSMLFLVAFLSRAASSLFLSKKADAPVRADLHKPAREIWELVKHPAYQSFFGFLFFFFVMISISSPFVTPYMLEKLHLDYHQYMLSLAALFVAKIAVLPLVSPLMQKHGTKKVFFWGVLGVSPLPALWVLSDQLWFVISLQALSGVFWGFFEVALSVTFFSQIKPRQKIIALTAYNFFNASAIILGSLIGGQIIKDLDASPTSYALIFVGGALLRCAVGGWYFWKTRSREELLSDTKELAIRLRSFEKPVTEQVKIG